MSADELRQAAETLRALVEALDPWGEDAEECGYETWADHHRAKAGDPAPDRAERGFISTMHPGVGLALADWLSNVARNWDAQSGGLQADATDVARLINSGAA